MLGMWTVTWLLKPVVVMGHLLGGLTTFSLLVWMAWRATDRPRSRWPTPGCCGAGWPAAWCCSASRSRWAAGSAPTTRRWPAALDFPKCVGQWWPPADFREGFVLWRGIGVDYEGGVLDGASRIAIQLTHRMLAVVVALYLLAWRCACSAPRACAAGR
jgi:cytochrome c oxidase assembly protein subunit 15